jgi:hypothetical protein
MYEKKQPIHKTPDLTKMQAVIIDHRTTVYITLDADPKEAKRRYLSRPDGFKKP